MLSRFFATKLQNALPAIHTGEYIIKARGEMVRSSNFYYCLGILIPAQKEYGFMHFQGCENLEKDRLQLNQMIDELRAREENPDVALKAQVYCNLPGDEHQLPHSAVSSKYFDPASLLSRMHHNISAVAQNLEKHNNIDLNIKCGGSPDIFIDRECNIQPISRMLFFDRWR